MIFDYSNNEPKQRYKLMSQTIIPRPIAWVVTEMDGIINIAPFSYFTALSSNPATLILSVGHKSDTTPKDTLRNLRENKKCTICIIGKEHLEAMHFSSKELGSQISEAKVFGIETKRIFDDFPPMVKGVPVAFFCEFYKEIDLHQSKTIPLIVEIKQQFIDDACIIDYEELTFKLDPLARVGKNYATLGKEIKSPNI
jgi:flavin reductase (DIM6/NTAB) family NADH-FMN oxidoreductase RutF